MDVAARISGVELKENFYSTFKYVSKAEHTKRVYEAKTNLLHIHMVTFPELPAGGHNDGAIRAISIPATAEAIMSVDSPTGASDNTDYTTVVSKEQDELDWPSTPATAMQKEKTLKRSTRGPAHRAAVWLRLVSEPSDCVGLPVEVEIWCQRCKENTRVSSQSPYYREGSYPLDRKPNWTKGAGPKYIEVKPKCLSCAEERWPWKRFIPVNPEISSIDMDGLRDWAQKHSFLSTEAAIERLAARPTMSRERVVQRKPGFGKAQATRRKRELNKVKRGQDRAG